MVQTKQITYVGHSPITSGLWIQLFCSLNELKIKSYIEASRSVTHILPYPNIRSLQSVSLWKKSLVIKWLSYADDHKLITIQRIFGLFFQMLNCQTHLTLNCSGMVCGRNCLFCDHTVWWSLLWLACLTTKPLYLIMVSVAPPSFKTIISLSKWV